MLWQYRHGFRPLIGVSFCKLVPFCSWDDNFVFVSVPLSGLASVNLYSTFIPFINSHICFRPLIGVSFCKHETQSKAKYQHSLLGFRPLIGVSFCKRFLKSA